MMWQMWQGLTVELALSEGLTIVNEPNNNEPTATTIVTGTNTLDASRSIVFTGIGRLQCTNTLHTGKNNES